jgi:hypothetical protein
MSHMKTAMVAAAGPSVVRRTYSPSTTPWSHDGAQLRAARSSGRDGGGDIVSITAPSTCSRASTGSSAAASEGLMAMGGGDGRDAAVPEDQGTSRSASCGPVAHLVRMTHGCLPVSVCHDAIVRNLRGRVNASPPAMALAKRHAIRIIDARESPRARPRHMTPSLVRDILGVANVIVHDDQSAAERTFRLDRVRECWLA